MQKKQRFTRWRVSSGFTRQWWKGLWVTPAGTDLTEGLADLLFFSCCLCQTLSPQAHSIPHWHLDSSGLKTPFPLGRLLSSLLILPKGEWPMCQQDRDPEMHRSFTVSLNPYRDSTANSKWREGVSRKQEVITVMNHQLGFELLYH